MEQAEGKPQEGELGQIEDEQPHGHSLDGPMLDEEINQRITSQQAASNNEAVDESNASVHATASPSKRKRAPGRRQVKPPAGSSASGGAGEETFRKETGQQEQNPKAGTRRSKRQRTQEVVTFSDDHQHETAHYEASQLAPHVTEDPNHPEIPGESRAGVQPAAEAHIAPEHGGAAATHAEDIQAMSEELKYSPLQLRAWILTGQPLNLPGYQWPPPLPHVHMGARWQLDLRTGERLEEPSSAHMNMNHLATIQAQNPNAYTIHNAALGAQALGARPNVFGTSQAGQSYGIIPSGAQYSVAGGQGADGTGGSYTSLLAPQMLAQGLMAPQTHLPTAFQHLVQQMPSRRHRATMAPQEGDEAEEIPLRRRGRPAGDGATVASTPQELQERRMQANRAAASRSHFRRKREMELMEKECAISADRIQELRISLATLHQQEEQLRMQQQTIRSQLAAGIKPDDSLSLPAIFHVLGGQQDPVGREDAEQAALNAMLQAQMGTLGGAPMEAV